MGEEHSSEGAGQQVGARRQLGAQVMPSASIPKGIADVVAAKLGDSASCTPARQDGGYKGRIIYSNERYVVQAVGKQEANAVVHRKPDLEFVGQKLAWRSDKNLLTGVDVQIHYQGAQAKAYVWNRERDQGQRARGENMPLPGPEDSGKAPGRDDARGPGKSPAAGARRQAPVQSAPKGRER